MRILKHIVSHFWGKKMSCSPRDSARISACGGEPGQVQDGQLNTFYCHSREQTWQHITTPAGATCQANIEW